MSNIAEQDNLNKLIVARKNDAIRLLSEFQCSTYAKETIIGKIESFTTIENLTSYDTVADMIAIKASLDEIKKEKIVSLDEQKNKEILTVYPLYKQINITNLVGDYTEEDKTTMKGFIQTKREEYKTKKEEINNCNSIDELEALGAESEVSAI